MRAKAIFLVFVLFGFSTLRAEKIADLKDVMEPASIRIDGNSVYIPDRSVIHFYTLEPLALIKSFGMRGEGPGEFNSTPHVKIYEDGLFLNCSGKIMQYTREGEFVHQTKLPFRLFYFYYPLLKVEENYVGFPLDRENKICGVLFLSTAYTTYMQASFTFWSTMTAHLSGSFTERKLTEWPSIRWLGETHIGYVKV